MIVLDTDVVSELMRDNPWPAVLAWVNDQLVHNLFVTAVTEAEIRAGIAFLPEGKRRRGLANAAERAFSELFSGRVLPFDGEAARSYAGIAAERRHAGRPIGEVDCQIAAISRARGAVLVTRNVRDFEGTGLNVIDPWSVGPC